jgi:hypothetical protein
MKRTACFLIAGSDAYQVTEQTRRLMRIAAPQTFGVQGVITGAECPEAMMPALDDLRSASTITVWGAAHGVSRITLMRAEWED